MHFFRLITKICDHFIADPCIHANFTPKKIHIHPPPMTDVQYIQFLYQLFLKYTLFLQVIDEIGNDFAEER